MIHYMGLATTEHQTGQMRIFPFSSSRWRSEELSFKSGVKG